MAKTKFPNGRPNDRHPEIASRRRRLKLGEKTKRFNNAENLGEKTKRFNNAENCFAFAVVASLAL